ncbi:hypothetical protein HMPREF9413_5854 [Paenibacillus sp. HGF7]|nr:hypothetical protein [Paenibacillus chitinolyticus]EGL16581.1 hypothetical protein HMPREF9413_5854 [Paenibacillus sp. HGF7]EPD82367.1 hypothetical protein HMPREF1207_04194 [Paenibacillus sp. HGH0039]
MSHVIKKHVIFKRDKWNMVTVEVNGSRLVAREISDQWGEDTHTFLSRPALMHWAQERFPRDSFEGTDEEYDAMMEAFRNV